MGVKAVTSQKVKKLWGNATYIQGTHNVKFCSGMAGRRNQNPVSILWGNNGKKAQCPGGKGGGCLSGG